MNSFQQMPLALKPPRRPSFDNFVVGDNAAVVSTLQGAPAVSGWTLLAGSTGSGKSHLLTALFNQALASGHEATFVSLSDATRWPLLDDTTAGVVVLDDVDAVAGNNAGEMRLFNALNRWHAEQSSVVMTACGVSAFVLPDLRSRLSQATRLSLKPLEEAGLEAMAQQLVADQDMRLSPDVAQYLVTRMPRNAHALTQAVNALMAQALSERREITKPMVKALLDQ
ncbi:MAG: DnaA/Hda family protein [Wenzhouxiangella sp.]|nr:DnaA/Hda family protein [Wenzhouxiangella sp.]MDR9452634.1 DnaA/Hda family protein [Wenzhouxiangella sp.]